MPSDSNVRLDARLPNEVHDLVKRAAELQGHTTSDFFVTAAREAAEKAIAEAFVVRLSTEDQFAFVRALASPPPPAPALRRAFRRYRKLIARTA